MAKVVLVKTTSCCSISLANILGAGKMLPNFPLEVPGACSRWHTKRLMITFEGAHHIRHQFSIFFVDGFGVWVSSVRSRRTLSRVRATGGLAPLVLDSLRITMMPTAPARAETLPRSTPRSSRSQPIRGFQRGDRTSLLDSVCHLRSSKTFIGVQLVTS